ncbi:MAG: hypothetical protein JO208_08610 [Alphaproteobacteria bacterium]|nr:hypothetical protein [Alphaproteobacteria bacterium]
MSNSDTSNDAAQREADKLKKQQWAAKKKAEERAAKGLIIPPGVWVTEAGVVKPTYDNCWQLLEMSADTWGMAYDVLGESYIFRGNVPWEPHYGRELNGDLVRGIRNWLLDAFETEFKKCDIEDALLSICRARPYYNPICEHLDLLKWDGTPRIDGWLQTYFGSPDDPYHRAVGRRFLLGAVARARRPGTKFDPMPTFEAGQGSGKSTALRILGGEFFSDAPLGDLDNRDAAIALQRIWIYELGELNDVTRAKIEAVKRFLSTCVDRYRGINEKRRTNHPRSCVFAGTTNQMAYLLDMSGDRRFWPVRTSREVKLKELERDRDLLWAEASMIEAQAAKEEAHIPIGIQRPSLELPRELWIAAGKEQAERRIVDPWVDTVSAWLENQGGERVFTKDILENCFSIPKGEQRTDHGQRVARVMQAIGGWRHRPKLRIGKVAGLSGYVREAILDVIAAEEAEAEAKAA